jgi:hypothetical protein
MTKEIRLNAFDMNCVGHIQRGMWMQEQAGFSRSRRKRNGRSEALYWFALILCRELKVPALIAVLEMARTAVAL